MLERIGAAIRAMLAAMKAMVWKTVRVGDKLISMLVPGPAPIEPVVQDDPAAEVAAVESMTALRNAANLLVQGHTLPPALVKVVPGLQVAWLQAMSRHELCKLILSRDDAIRLHLRGIAPIHGLVPFDAEAIRDVAAARAQRPQPARVPRRTLRAVLAEQEEAERSPWAIA